MLSLVHQMAKKAHFLHRFDQAQLPLCPVAARAFMRRPPGPFLYVDVERA